LPHFITYKRHNSERRLEREKDWIYMFSLYTFDTGGLVDGCIDDLELRIPLWAKDWVLEDFCRFKLPPLVRGLV
jgi:hypothetical protein